MDAVLDIVDEQTMQIVNEKMGQIYAVTIKCPSEMDDFGMLYNSMCSNFKIDGPVEENDLKIFKNVPKSDLYFMLERTYEYCDMINCPTDGLVYLASLINSFPNLKYVTVEFTDDDEIYDIYSTEMTASKMKKIYNIDTIQIILYDKLHQDTIDLINKNLIFNDLIPNEYLKRRFVVDFTFKEYTSYIDMVISNNMPYFESESGQAAIDFLKLFPKHITKSKPNVRLITNYSEI